MDVLLRILRLRFPSAIPTGLESFIRDTRDLTLLDGWLDAALVAHSVGEFGKMIGLPPAAPTNGV